MLTLVQFFPAWGLPNASPFCLKLETYLRMANIPYNKDYTSDPRKSPTGKFPIIKQDDQVFFDSGLIINRLKNQYGDLLDNHLTPEEMAQGLCMQRMIEEHLYWVLVYSRWGDERNWDVVKKTFFGRLPLLLKAWLPKAIRKKVLNQIKCQGLGLLDPHLIYELGKADIVALSRLLGEKDFFFGDRPTSYDACAYATLINFLVPPIESPIKALIQKCSNLVAFCEEIHDRYYPDKQLGGSHD